MDKLYELKLSLEELKIIDGKVNEKAQSVIDIAKQEKGYGFELPIMNEILRKAEQNGELTWRNKSITNCNLCDKERDYYTYPRSGKYHRKGDKNYNKPKYYSGIKFNEGFVVMQGYGDMCTDCEEKYKVKESLIDYIIDNDLKIEIQRNDYKEGKYLKDPIKICFECKKEMKESEMGSSSTLMGDGHYKSTCPYCAAKSMAFGKSHETTNKFDVVENPMARKEIEIIKKWVDEYNDKLTEDEVDDKKIKYFNHHKNENIFIVSEVKWKNGNRELIRINLKDKKFYVGRFYKNEVDYLKKILIDAGYVESE